MAVDLGKLVSKVKVSIGLDALADKIIAVDAYNTIYQFLSIIRQPNGMPLTDSDGRVTSHLSGLFYRTANLLEAKVLPIFVFDGIPSVLKQRTIEARMNRRSKALEEWNAALEKGMISEARVHAMASTRIDKEIIESSKRLLGLMGVATIQAPGEGEAQAARMTEDSAAYASASQDYDSFLFGATTVIRNLTISGRRKLPGRDVYVNVGIESVQTASLLAELGINQQQLVLLGALIGTDFNEGIDRVGPMTALKIVKEHKTMDDVSAYVKQKYGRDMDEDLKNVTGLFENPETTHIASADVDQMLKRSKPDKEGMISFMCDRHGFSPERIGKFAERIVQLRNEPHQKGINKWL